MVKDLNKLLTFLLFQSPDCLTSQLPKVQIFSKQQCRKIEKQILREAFCEYLPNDILHRQKEQFSDGVGYDWIDTLKDITNKEVSNELLDNAKHKFPIQTPKTKEEYYYRNIFSKHFSSDSAALTVPSVPSIACSSEIAIKWDKNFHNQIDPSGRAIMTVHKK